MWLPGGLEAFTRDARGVDVFEGRLSGFDVLTDATEDGKKRGEGTPEAEVDVTGGGGV